MSDFDKQAFLASLELNDDERKVFDSVLAKEKNEQEIKRGWMARSDYSKKMDDVRRLEEEAKRKDEAADQYYSSLTAWEQTEKTRLEAEAAAAREEAARLKRAIAGEPDPSLPPPPAAPAFDVDEFKKQFVSADQLRPMAQSAIDLPFKVQDYAARYERLKGEKYYGWETFKNLAMENSKKGISIDQTAEEVFKFTELEAAQQAKELEVTTQRMAEEKYQAMLSNASIPGAQAGVPQLDQTIFSPEFAEQKPAAEQPSDTKMREEARGHFLETLKDPTLPPMFNG